MSEVLRFFAINSHVVTVTASRTSSPFSQFTLNTFSISAFSLCLLCGCFWFAGQATYVWELVLVSRAFSGGFDRVLGLGFLLPPCAFCGLLILLCGKAKGWDMDVGGVRFSERFCR